MTYNEFIEAIERLGFEKKEDSYQLLDYDIFKLRINKSLHFFQIGYKNMKFYSTHVPISKIKCEEDLVNKLSKLTSPDFFKHYYREKKVNDILK